MSKLIARIKSTYWFWKMSKEYPGKFVMEVHRNPYRLECWYPSTALFLKENPYERK